MLRLFAREAIFLIALLTGSRASLAGAQQPSTRVAVYLDCQGGGCDFDFFRQEIGSVNWVRDRAVADVHVLLTTQETGAGGTQYTLAFLGLGRFAGKGDTLTYSAEPTAVQDERRKGIAQVLRVGLVRFVARASGYDALKITFEQGDEDAKAKPTRDRWNLWVFEITLSGFTDGDRTDKFLGGDGELNARRVTERWKTIGELNASYNESSFELSEGEKFTNIQRNYDFEFEQIASIGRHFAAGITGGIGTSTFSNQRRVTKFAPAVEYDVFPYSEATRRALTFQYAAGLTHYIYEDSTIYFKLREGVAVQQVRAALAAQQPWGNVEISALFRNQIMDAAKRRASIGGHISVRIVRGLSVNFGGNLTSIHDQINLRLADVSDEEILVRQRERGTSYRYSANFGVSYTFGSILNNIVNPRFDIGSFF
jgi:hypothetical protein